MFTAIYKRIYNALTCEFKILYKLNRKNLKDDTYSAYLGEQASVQQDFADDGCLVTPVADPNSVTMMMRMAMAQFLMQLAEAPLFQGKLNADEILKRVMEAAGIDGVEKLIVPPQPPQPIVEETALANLDKIKADAAHNYALAGAEQARGEHFQAKTASEVMKQMPSFNQNPTGK